MMKRYEEMIQKFLGYVRQVGEEGVDGN